MFGLNNTPGASDSIMVDDGTSADQEIHFFNLIDHETHSFAGYTIPSTTLQGKDPFRR